MTAESEKSAGRPETPSTPAGGAGGRSAGVAVNAALGVDRESFVDTWKEIIAAASGQPRALFDAGLQFNRELLDVLVGASGLEPAAGDSRFQDPAWTQNPVYRRIGQAYVAWTRSLDRWLESSELDGMNRSRARFVLDALKDVLAPVNLLPTNPEAMRRALESRGRSLFQGLKNFIDDQRHNHGYPAVADREGFVIGRDVANTEGAVIFRNELFELMQYGPLTDTVDETPVLYVFSQVNRFYLGDLTPDRSLFQRLLERGVPVFAISWRNPKPEHRDWNLDTYAEGVINAIAVIRDVLDVEQVHLMGLCAGGISAATAAAVLAKRKTDWIRTLSLFVNVLDNRVEDSDFGLFVSERSIAAQKQRVAVKGMYDEKDVFEMFAWLRWEENIMSFLRRNYLLGEQPLRHPLLFWSMDYTRLPAGLHAAFLDLSLENKLVKRELKVLGKRLDLSKIEYPVYLMAGATDHITPWKACYRSSQLFGGETTFVLTAQNHTQTISTREDNAHLRYWIADALPADPDAWSRSATEHPGFWAFHWVDWLKKNGTGSSRDAASEYGNERYPALGRAPGRYVLE